MGIIYIKVSFITGLGSEEDVGDQHMDDGKVEVGFCGYFQVRFERAVLYKKIYIIKNCY